MFNHLKNLKLSTKALMATMIPLIINVGWLAAMWGNSLQVAHLASMEREQANLVERVNEFTQLYYELQGAFMTAFYTGTTNRLDVFLRNRDQFNNMTNSLHQSPLLNEKQLAALGELQHFADYEANFLKENSSNGSEDRWRMFTKHRQLFLSVFKSRIDDPRNFKEFVMPQREKLDALRQQQESQQQFFMVLLVAGVSVNLLIAGFVHYLFSRYVTQQVDGLVSNAYALSEKKPMLKPLVGKDDFAIIDEALHYSERELAEAVAYRQALMQMIAHDLKSPLSASQVSLATILVHERASLNERGLKIINGVVSNNKRLLALISDLLTVDAFESGHLDLSVKESSVTSCIDEAVDTLSGLAGSKSLKITVRVADDAQNAIFDHARILQVLVNLLSNAIKFSKLNSEIVIESQVLSPNKLKVSVVDQGFGISEKDKPMIFQRYFQTESGKRAKGTGLGLAITKFVVETHGETIDFDSSLNGGSTFWFTLTRA